ncbi:MAG: hypothetical protein ACR2JO_04570 [Mycobacteriales bacterium]
MRGRLVAVAALLVAGVLLSRHRRWLLVPFSVGYVAVAALAGALLVPPLVTDRTVNETVVTGAAAPASAAPAGAAPAAGPVQVAAGSFSALAHHGTGRVALMRLPDGGYRVTLTEFRTDNGPDLRVYLVPGNPRDGAAPHSVDLGALKGNRGN